MTDARVKEYGKKVQQYFESENDLFKKFNEKVQLEV